MMINGGKFVEPTLLDRVQDGNGKNIYVHGNEVCPECQQDEWDGSPPPERPDERPAVIDPVTAYQITSMMKGVVDNGTGRTIKTLGRPLGGKTGTTNDFFDAWFVGFSPDLVTGVYVGYDSPRTLNNEAGGVLAAPIFKAFMGEVLKDAPKVPFRIPEGVKLAPVNRDTGEPSFIGAPNYILEAFKPGTEPGLNGLNSSVNIGNNSSYIGSAFGNSTPIGPLGNDDFLYEDDFLDNDTYDPARDPLSTDDPDSENVQNAEVTTDAETGAKSEDGNRNSSTEATNDSIIDDAANNNHDNSASDTGNEAVNEDSLASPSDTSPNTPSDNLNGLTAAQSKKGEITPNTDPQLLKARILAIRASLEEDGFDPELVKELNLLQKQLKALENTDKKADDTDIDDGLY